MGGSVEDELAGKPDVTVLRRTTVFGSYDGGTYGAVERVSDHLATEARPTAAAHLAHRRQARRARIRRDRTAHRIRRQ